jgi:glycerol-3-phosphate acyltransferase PlsY
MGKIIAVIVISYFIGSIPNGYIISKKFYGIDITKYGSGNIGMTNVQRVLGNKPAFIVLLLDLSKGAIAILLGRYVAHNYTAMMLSGVAAVIGHDYSIFMPHFKGGKGVAATYGVAALINFPAAVLSFLTFLGIVIKTKYVSLGSIISISLYPLFLFLLRENKTVILWSIIYPVLVIYSHRENIKRLLNGTERKLGEKVKINERH